MRYLVTSALPYANGPIHLGHIAGAYLPADIYVRFLRNSGREVIYICGTDEHGVPITINAEQNGKTPPEVVAENHRIIEDAFRRLEMSFDIFSGTSTCPDHAKLSQDFFLTLRKNGFISERDVDQFYCDHDAMFLPDRYVEGVCPHCGKGARGDQCDYCGNALNSLELKEPKCKLCAKTPVVKSSRHWFLDLDKFQKDLDIWLKGKPHWKANVKAFCEQWFQRGLEPRGITRDISWGVPVPIEGAKGKVLYVWFDAPIGYISFTIELFRNLGRTEDWKKWWQGGKDVKLVHFIGKDNIVFHAIIWPAMLMGQKGDWKLPDEIPANEFLNLEGDKFSTSKNYAIWLHEFLNDFNSDVIRYYLAQIAPEAKDADFSLKGFQTANNSELADIYGNFVNRILSFTRKFFDGTLGGDVTFTDAEKALWAEAKKESDIIKECYDTFKVRDAVFHLMELGRIANKYVDTSAPWSLRKTDEKRCKAVLLTCLNLIDTLATAFEPITPAASRKVKKMLNLPETFDLNALCSEPMKPGHTIGEPAVLYPKIEDAAIEKWREKLGINS
ncbi:MAG TPA: methionine--tRNA ligase [bacterium]|nr:methionine--tRNA ligase [bacterium]